MATELLLIRHGQSEGNIRQLFYGHTDGPLTPLGQRQAELTGKYLKDEKIDLLYSSDLIRAHDTAAATAERKGMPIISDCALREINAGEWEGRPFDELFTAYPKSYADVWLNDIGNSKADGGESVADLQNRVVSFILGEAAKHDGKTLAFFSHGTPIRAFFALAYGFSLSRMKDLPWPTNASVSRASFDKGCLTVRDYSFDRHLDEFTSSLTGKV